MVTANLWALKLHILVKIRQTVLNWIYPNDFTIKHAEISKRRQESTGNWVLTTPEYQEFEKDISKCRLLWGYGIRTELSAGASKTFLSSVVIDYVQDCAQMLNYGLAYVYFDYMEQAQQTPSLVLASLVKQLNCQLSYLPMEIELLRKIITPSDEDLYSAFLATLKVFSRAFLVFDALDECSLDQRKALLPLFHRLEKVGISVFVTSRPHPEDIQSSFQDVAKVKLSAKQEDIEIYIEQKIDEDPRAKRIVGQGKCKDMIISALQDCAKGMFLLVRFQIEYVCQQPTVRQILKELERLKNSSVGQWPLDPTYDRIINSIHNQPQSCTDLALATLSWLVKAKRVLTVDELREAVSVEADRYELDEWDLPDRKTLFDVCAGLVIIDEGSQTARLAHYTIQEYLLQKRILPEDTDFRLAMACTTYFSFDIFSRGVGGSRDLSIARRLELYPFLRYAAKYLDAHLKACDLDLTTVILLRFLENLGNIKSYLEVMNHNGYSYPDESGVNQDQTPLHVASSLGHCPAVRMLLEKGADISCQTMYGRTVLHSAALGRQLEVFQLLLEKGTDISVQDKAGMTALHCAIERGAHIEIISLLLKNGADLSMRDISGVTALYYAVERDLRLEVIQLLLESGANISAQDKSGMTALHYAVKSRTHIEATRLLLEKGADIQIQDDYGMTALHYAARGGGHIGVIQLLLKDGADVSGQSKSGATALHYALKKGCSYEVIRLLVENSIDISRQDRYGRTALHRALYGGSHIEVVRLFLKNGADVSGQSKSGMTALHYAVREGCDIEVIRLPLEGSTDILAQGKLGKAVLHHAAIRRSQPDAVMLLLEKGADPFVKDHHGRTALQEAELREDKAIAQLLGAAMHEWVVASPDQQSDL